MVAHMIDYTRDRKKRVAEYLGLENGNSMDLFVRAFLCLLCCLVLPVSLSAQEASLVELESNLRRSSRHEKLAAFNRLAEFHEEARLNKALKYARQAVEYGNKLFPRDGEGSMELFQAYYLLGKFNYYKYNYIQSYKNLKKAQDLAGLLNTNKHAEEIGRYLGNISEKIEEIEEIVEIDEVGGNVISQTLQELKMGLKLEETKKDILIQGKIIAAKVNEKNGVFDEAIDAYKGTIELLQEKGEMNKAQEIQLHVAFLLDSLNEHIEAQKFLKDVVPELSFKENPLALELETPVLEHRIKPERVRPRTPEVNRDRASLLNARARSRSRSGDSIRVEKDNLKNISERFARENNYKKSLEYFMRYQELTEKILEDSLLSSAEDIKKENELLLLKQQKRIADLNVQRMEEERIKDAQILNTAIGISLLILLSSLVIYYFYFAKKREHKKLSIAYRDLDKTKNKLVGAEQKIVKLLKQHVSGDVAAELLSSNFNENGERRFVCIMFLDIRDFTPMAEQMTPEELINYQNDVFGFMIDVVHKHNGNINQLLGDGFMATFGAPVSHGNDCQNAFLAAREILAEVKERNEAGVIRKTKIGIGLHAGLVVTGNVGTESRKQYSVTGNPVIIASRVEQLNKTYKSQFIITEEVHQKLDHPLDLKQPYLEVAVKGRSNPVKILKLA